MKQAGHITLLPRPQKRRRRRRRNVGAEILERCSLVTPYTNQGTGNIFSIKTVWDMRIKIFRVNNIQGQLRGVHYLNLANKSFACLYLS